MKIAVIGAGVSDLSSTWAVNEYSCHEVHLFELLPWIGGHVNTVSFAPPTCASPLSVPSIPVDTGFIVFNEVTYPNFVAFLKLAGIAIIDIVPAMVVGPFAFVQYWMIDQDEW